MYEDMLLGFAKKCADLHPGSEIPTWYTPMAEISDPAFEKVLPQTFIEGLAPQLTAAFDRGAGDYARGGGVTHIPTLRDMVEGLRGRKRALIMEAAGTREGFTERITAAAEMLGKLKYATFLAYVRGADARGKRLCYLENWPLSIDYTIITPEDYERQLKTPPQNGMVRGVGTAWVKLSERGAVGYLKDHSILSLQKEDRLQRENAANGG